MNGQQDEPNPRRPLRILHLEDNPLDADLTRIHLAEQAVECTVVRAQTREEFVAALDDKALDLIVADYSLPAFDGMEALQIVRERGLELPFIFLSGAIGEERAIEALRNGATDYVLKDSIGRLGPAVRRAMQEVEERRHRRRVEAALRESEDRLRLATTAADLGTWDYNPVTGALIWSDRCKDFFGIPRDAQVSYETFLRGVHREDRERADGAVQRSLDPRGTGDIDIEFRTVGVRDGVERWLRSRGRALFEGGRPVRCIGTIQDITALKRVEEELRRLNATLEERVGERTRRLREYQEQLRVLASELTLAEQRERRRIATSLHDDLAQSLVISQMKLALIRAPVPADIAAKTVEEIREALNEAIQYTRTLMQELSPPMLYDLGLEPALEWLADRMGQQHGLKVAFEDDGSEKPLGDDLRSMLYSAVRELLFNVIKYARTEEARIALAREGGMIVLRVEDRGAGFDPANLSSHPSDKGGFGLFTIRERLDLLGGELDIRSSPGEGTCVTLVAPLAQGEPTAEAQPADASGG